MGIIPATGGFEITNESHSGVVAEGNIRLSEDNPLQVPSSYYEDHHLIPTDNRDLLDLTHEDAYRLLRVRGYQYKPYFKGYMSGSNGGIIFHVFFNIP